MFAAASTREALSEIGDAWARTGKPRARFSWGASGDLARQIEAGAPGDVFLSADARQMDGLEKNGHLAKGTRRDLLSNGLVVVVPTSSNVTIASAKDLAKLGRIALGDPKTVPAGAYARAWLEREGAWKDIEGKFLPALDVRAALAAVQSGGVDAAVVYRTDARIAKDIRVAFEPKDPPRIVYPIAALARSQGDMARLFVEFLASKASREVFERHGFGVLG